MNTSKGAQMLNEQERYARVAEHRLVDFFMREAMEVPRDSNLWESLLPREIENFLTFENLYRECSDLKPKLSFLRLPKMTRKDLTYALTRHPDCKLTSPAEYLCPGEIDGLVFNFDGIKGGLVMHVVELPLDLKSGSMFWTTGEHNVRLQRFAEFCLAMRAFDWSSDESKLGSDSWAKQCLTLSLKPASEIATKLQLFWLSVTAEPELAFDLHRNGWQVEFRIVDGLSFVSVAPTTLAELMSCSVSTVKRALRYLVKKRVFEQASIDSQRFAAYRCNTSSKGFA